MYDVNTWNSRIWTTNWNEFLLYDLRSYESCLHIYVVERERPERESTRDLCDADVVLYKLSYQADWEFLWSSQLWALL